MDSEDGFSLLNITSATLVSPRAYAVHYGASDAFRGGNKKNINKEYCGLNIRRKWIERPKFRGQNYGAPLLQLTERELHGLRGTSLDILV